VPRLPSKVATTNIPEWDASVGYIREKIDAMRRAKTILVGHIGDTRIALDKLAKQAYRADMDHVAAELRRMIYDIDDDLRTTSLLSSLKGVDDEYHKLIDHPFGRVANDDLVKAWGRTLR